MATYYNKTPLGLKPKNSAAAAVDAPVVEDKPIDIEPEFVSIAGLASQGRDKLLDAMRAHQEKTKAAQEYVPPPQTARQLSQTEREMAAGRKASARHAEQAAYRPQPKPEASDGYTVPSYRPGDHVPNFDSKDPGARTLK